MMQDRFRHCIQFLWGKPEIGQNFTALLDGVWDVIPAGKLLGILRTVPKKYTEVMHPRGGEQHVVIVVHASANLRGEGVQPGLMAEFFDGACLSANELNDARTPVLS